MRVGRSRRAAWSRRAVAATVVTVSACGSSSNGGSSSGPVTLEVIARADVVGYGCFYDHTVTRGTQLVVRDDSDRTLGIGTFHNATTCHWTAHVTVPSSSFYDLRTPDGDLGTVQRNGRQTLIVDVHMRYAGSVKITAS